MAEAKMFDKPAPKTVPDSKMHDGRTGKDATAHPDNEQPEDHLARIREIAMMLPESSPSGATTASQKILMHLDAYANPEAYEAQRKKEREEEEEAEKIRAERRGEVKEPVEPAKV